MIWAFIFLLETFEEIELVDQLLTKPYFMICAFDYHNSAQIGDYKPNVNSFQNLPFNLVQGKFVLPNWLLYSLSMDLLLELKEKRIFFGRPSAIDDGGVCRRYLLGIVESKKVHNLICFQKFLRFSSNSNLPKLE